jgi:hypothetical protein
MFTKTTFAFAFALATASSAHAATKQQSVQPSPNGYDARGAYVGAKSFQPSRTCTTRAARLSVPIRTPRSASSCVGTRTGGTNSRNLDNAEADLRAGRI